MDMALAVKMLLNQGVPKGEQISCVTIGYQVYDARCADRDIRQLRHSVRSECESTHNRDEARMRGTSHN